MSLNGRPAALASAVVVTIAVLAGCGAGPATAPAGSARTSGSAGAVAGSPADSPSSSPSGPEAIEYQNDCRAIVSAWSTFLTSYHGTTSIAEKNLAAATAASGIANAVYDLTNKLLSASQYRQSVLAVTNSAFTFENDFSQVEKYLQAGDTTSADSVIAGQLPNDENVVSDQCGSR
jgi:hypothetical protein